MSFAKQTVGAGIVLAMSLLSGCEGVGEKDLSRPAVSERKSMQERMSENSGFTQDADGNWIPKSDKRSAYDSQRESPYFKGKVDKKTYKTGDYAKKNWWGKQSYGQAGAYEGNTDGSRFQSQASQDGQVFVEGDKMADRKKPYSTNRISRESAYEEGRDGIERTSNTYTESQRSTYKAPSVIDWKEQRQMSDRSRGILGR